MDTKKRIIAEVPTDFHRTLKLGCVERGCTIQDAVLKGLENLINELKTPKNEGKTNDVQKN